jgi:signal transduction histidine kinase
MRAGGIAAAGPLPDEAGQHLEQILREALSNAARHAGPCEVDVRLTFAPDELELAVSDTGRGLGGREVDATGQGLRNMRERARRLGGRLAVDSGVQGTRITLSVPLDSECPADTDAVAPPLEEVPPRWEEVPQ